MLFVTETAFDNSEMISSKVVTLHERPQITL